MGRKKTELPKARVYALVSEETRAELDRVSEQYGSGIISKVVDKGCRVVMAEIKTKGIAAVWE